MFGFRKPAFDEMRPDIAARDLDRFHVIDVRSPAEFHGELGHVPGSQLVPLTTLTEAASSWDTSLPLLVVCRSGRRAAGACATLARAGFESVTNLSGGMLAWAAQGLPTSQMESAA